MDCNRCGQCCHFEIDGKLKRCRFLKKTGSKFFCRIYKNRLGVTVYKNDLRKIICGLRYMSKFDFKGCPQNTNKSIKNYEV